MIGGVAIGLDPVTALLELAPDDPRVTYMAMKPGEVPLPDASVDAVWVCLVLGGITDEPELRQTATELERVLRPGGMLFLAENTSEMPAPPALGAHSARSRAPW